MLIIAYKAIDNKATYRGILGVEWFVACERAGVSSCHGEVEARRYGNRKIQVIREISLDKAYSYWVMDGPSRTEFENTKI
jgi:hypothetical protein